MRDAALQSMLTETVARVTHDNPVQGNWCVDGNEFTVRLMNSSSKMPAGFGWRMIPDT